MCEYNKIINQILEKYKYLTPINEPKVFNFCDNFIFFKCYVNTFEADEYNVITEKYSLLPKHSFLATDNISNFNLYGKEQLDYFTYNVSDPNFKNSGKGYSVVVININQVNIEAIYYFAGDEDKEIEITIIEDKYFIFYTNNVFLIQKIGEFNNEKFYLVMDGVCKVFENYLLVYLADGVYDYEVKNSLSLIHLDSKTEYNLAPILEKHNIHCDPKKTYIDSKTNELVVFDWKTDLSYNFNLEYIIENSFISIILFSA